MVDVAVPVPSVEPRRPVRHLAFEDAGGAVGIDGIGETKSLGAFAGPDARFRMSRVVRGVVAVALVAAHVRRGRDDLAGGC